VKEKTAFYFIRETGRVCIAVIANALRMCFLSWIDRDFIHFELPKNLPF